MILCIQFKLQASEETSSNSNLSKIDDTKDNVIVHETEAKYEPETQPESSSQNDVNEPKKTDEEMKKEMLDQLKKLGNMCLKPFGLSTESFEMVPQPGGGYSIQMKK